MNTLAAALLVQVGVASVYSGGVATTGERVAPCALTAAHRALPLGSAARVTSLDTGRAVIVRINDRGPFVKGRIIDLTPCAAELVGVDGLGRVKVEPVEVPEAGAWRFK